MFSSDVASFDSFTNPNKVDNGFNKLFNISRDSWKNSSLMIDDDSNNILEFVLLIERQRI